MGPAPLHLSARVSPQRCQELPLNDALFDVELEHPYRGRSLRSDRLDKGCSKDEVILPTVSPRMEEAYKRAPLCVDRTYIAPFPHITSKAGVGQVIAVRPASMFAADNVVDLMGRIRVPVMEKAILTTIGGALCDESSQGLAYVIAQNACAGEPALWP